jgi:hypothetical protein
MQNLNFTLIGRSPSGITQIWQITSVHTGVLLGQISWYSAWRRYVIFPESGTVYDSACLTEITKFLDEQMSIHSQGRHKEA